MKFGTLAAAAALTMLAQQHAFAQAKAKTPKKAKTPAATGKCVHNCAGYATCKGNGSNNCAGKNGCANEGIVPKECSSQTNEESCKKVVDKKNQNMCTWRDA